MTFLNLFGITNLQKIKRSELYLDFDKVGLNLTDIRVFITLLIASWVKRLLNIYYIKRSWKCSL